VRESRMHRSTRRELETGARSRDRSACSEVRGQRRIYSATAPALDPTGGGRRKSAGTIFTTERGARDVQLEMKRTLDEAPVE